MGGEIGVPPRSQKVLYSRVAISEYQNKSAMLRKLRSREFTREIVPFHECDIFQILIKKLLKQLDGDIISPLKNKCTHFFTRKIKKTPYKSISYPLF